MLRNKVKKRVTGVCPLCDKVIEGWMSQMLWIKVKKLVTGIINNVFIKAQGLALYTGRKYVLIIGLHST